MLSQRSYIYIVLNETLELHRSDLIKFETGIESGALHLRHLVFFSCREFEPEKAACRRDEPLTR
jgi:hypothetical protein